MPWLSESVATLPEAKDFAPDTVYVVGDGETVSCAGFLCPCGCGLEVYLPLIPGSPSRPRWHLHVAEDKKVTLSPSILQRGGCESHYYIVKGEVQWCGPQKKGAA